VKPALLRFSNGLPGLLTVVVAVCVLLPGLAANAATTAPQILLGVPQPVAGQSFTVDVLVEAPADVTPLATGNVTIQWGDQTAATVVTLSNSLVTAQHVYSSAGSYAITASYGGDSNFSAASASQPAIALAAAPAAVTLNTFGDSITFGVGASSAPYRYANVTATTEGWGLMNYGVAGDDSIDTCALINAASPLAANAYNTLLTGEDDLRHAMTSAPGEAEYTSAVQSCSVWLATTQATAQGMGRNTAANHANTTTGTWTPSTLYTNTGLNSTVAGSTLTGAITGNVLYAQLTETPTSDYSVSISVDGGAARTYAPPVLYYVGNRFSYGPYAVRIPMGGAATAQHTVKFTCVTPGSGGCYVDWFVGNGNVQAAKPPYLWLGTPYYTGQVGYQQSEYTLMAQLVRGVQSQLAADGLHVYLADVANWFQGPTNPNCMYDDIHPSDCGHAILAAVYVNAMNGLLANAPAVRLSTSGKHNFGYVADGLTESYSVQITNATSAAQPVALELNGASQFTQQTNCPASLAVAAKCEVVFTDTPAAGQPGLQSATWSVVGPTAVWPQNGGTLLGNSEPSTALTLNTTKHNFGTVARGQVSGGFALIVANPNSKPFTGSVTVSGATSQFQFQDGCTLPIPAFGSCIVSAYFAPTATGYQTMTITIAPSAGESITPGNVVTLLGFGQ
jgi:hypothetical protein